MISGSDLLAIFYFLMVFLTAGGMIFRGAMCEDDYDAPFW